MAEARNIHRFATALGAFSVGLGLAELVAPRAVASGRLGSRRGRLTAATAGVAAATALDVLASRRARAVSNGATGEHAAVRPRVVTINRALGDVYAFWRRFENLPLFMPHLRSVEVIDERWSQWVVDAFGTTIEWRAEITADERDRRIAWRSVEDADVPNEGEVTFTPAPGGRGTEVRVTMAYSPPAGAVGAAFAKLLGSDPGQRMQSDLRRLKQILETGEIPTTVGQTRGARSLLGKGLEALEHGSQS